MYFDEDLSCDDAARRGHVDGAASARAVDAVKVGEIAASLSEGGDKPKFAGVGFEMSAVAVISPASLPTLIDRAASALTSARSAAEVLEARDMAGLAYDAAKIAARFATAKGAHDSLVAAAHRAQADALEIEAQAKRRLADEYDAAQERGEVAGPRDGKLGRSQPERLKPPASDLGLTRKDIHEARIVRDAEAANPGIVRRTLDERLTSGPEPTKAVLRKALKAVATPPVAAHKTKTAHVSRRVTSSSELLRRRGRPDHDDTRQGRRNPQAQVVRQM
jgi:hypothetical protein